VCPLWCRPMHVLGLLLILSCKEVNIHRPGPQGRRHVVKSAVAKSWGQNVHCNKSEATQRKYDSVLSVLQARHKWACRSRRAYEKMYIPYSCTFILSPSFMQNLFVAKQCSNRQRHCSRMFVFVQQQQFPNTLLSSLRPTKSEITLSRSGCMSR